jgi:hypothetical protein
MKTFTILLLLESMILIPFIGTSLNNSTAFPQEHANKTNDNIPFKFPMPVESLNSDKILSRSNQYEHKEDHLLPNTKFTREHSILKDTIIPESKIIKKTKFNMSTDPSTRIEKKAPPVLLTSEGKGRSTYALQFKSQSYPIIYQITGSGNKLRNVSVEKDNATLQVNIDSKSNGTLTIQIPRLTSHAQKNSTSFTVFEDGQYYSDFEEKNSTKLKQLKIDFDRGTGQVEILAGHTSPEFSVISIVFALPVITFIILTRNQKKIRTFR